MRYLVILQAANPAGPPPEGLFEAIAKLGGEGERGVFLGRAAACEPEPPVA